jgi:hypothetical protein
MTGFLRNWLLAFVTPKPLIGALYLPRYLRHWILFARRSKDAKPKFRDSYPCLTDWSSATPFDPHYFFQGAWLARRLTQRRPAQHVDVGSSVLMLSVLSALVETVHIDYRPLKARLPGLAPVGGDITRLPLADTSITSLSCLHVIEHIGLGRYGDVVDPEGYFLAAQELARVLAPSGRLYITVPVGEPRVCFNAHRVFAPKHVEAMFRPLTLESFAYVDDRGEFKMDASTRDPRRLQYGCGMYEFRRDP